jgi:predicted nucleic acid-binding protein
MNVVDSSGWLEYFTDGRNADFFAPVIEKPEADPSYTLRLPMADSIILATARAYDAVLWTQDAHFEGLDRVRYIEKRTTT